jgi:Ca2+-binding RTX toxin-like protein
VQLNKVYASGGSNNLATVDLNDFKLTVVDKTDPFNGPSGTNLGLDNRGLGIYGGQGNYRFDANDGNNAIMVELNSSTLPLGVTGLKLKLTDFSNIDFVDIVLYDAAGAELYSVNERGNVAGGIVDLSDTNSLIEITDVAYFTISYDKTNGVSNGDIRLDSISYTPHSLAAIMDIVPIVDAENVAGTENLSWVYSYDIDISGNAVIQATVSDSTDDSALTFRSNGYYNYSHANNDTNVHPVNIGYALTASDGQSDSAQLVIHQIDQTLTVTNSLGNISGGGLNDAIIGDDDANILMGNTGNDKIAGGKGEDSIYGGSGADWLFGGAGEDIIFGNTGDDTLTGGNDSDTFVWQVADADAVDTVTDFEPGVNGDVLHLADLLQGENDGNLDDYLNFNYDEGNNETTLQVDQDGTDSGNQEIVLKNIDLTTLGVTDMDIIGQLLQDGNLITDSVSV